METTDLPHLQNQIPVNITVNNDKITGNYQLDLLKIDADTKEQINGAKFEIKYPHKEETIPDNNTI